MKMWKKLTAALMSIVMVVGLCPSFAFANEGGINADEHAVLTDASGDLGAASALMTAVDDSSLSEAGELVKAKIAGLSSDPRDYTAADFKRVEDINMEFEALSSEDKAILDAESHPDDGQSYGRVLESAVWAVRSFDTDDITALPNGTYTTTTTPAVNSSSDKGKSESTRERNWWVESVEVVNGHATAKIYVTSGAATEDKLTSYPSVWAGGVTVDRNESDNTYSIPVDLNGTTYFGGVSSKMPRPTMYALTTTIAEPRAYVVSVGSIKTTDNIDYGMFVPRYDGVNNTALIRVFDNDATTISFDNNRNTYNAIYLGELESGGTVGCLGQLPTDEQKASANFIETTTAGTTAPFDFTFAFDMQDLGKTVPYVTVSRSSHKFNASQLAFVFGETKTSLEAYEVIKKINEVPAAADVTIRDADAIRRARKAYDALTEEHKAEVTNYERLTTGEEAFDNLPDKDQATDDVETQINALVQMYDRVTAETASAVAAARTAYNALSKQQQAWIPVETVQKLARAEACVAFANAEVRDGMIVDTTIDLVNSMFVGASIGGPESDTYLYLYSELGEYTDVKKKSGTVSKSGSAQVINEVVTKTTWILGTNEAQGRVFTVALTGANGTSEDITVVIPRVFGTMSAGTYEVEAIQDPSTAMRKFQNAFITSDGTSMTATFTMPNTTYGKVYLGTKEAAAADAGHAIEPDTIAGASTMFAADGGNTFTIPIESMYQPITISYCNTSKNSWTEETIEFVVDEQTAAAIDAIAALNLNTYFNVTADQRDQVEAAQNLCEQLNENQMALMANSNYSILPKVVAMFAAADAVGPAIDSLPEADAMTVDDIDVVGEAKAAFNGMGASDVMKDALGGNTLQNSQLEKLVSQERKAKLAADVAKAQELDPEVSDVQTKIAALPAKKDVKATDKDAIKAARAAYNALPEMRKPLVTNVKKLTDAEDGLKALPPTSTELSITNNTGMFNAVSATAEVRADDSATLIMALNGTGYKWLYKGTYEEALAANDAIAAGIAAGKSSDKLIGSTVNAAEKLEFRIPLDEYEIGHNVPLVAISDSYYQKFVNGQNPLERAYYPRQLTVSLEAAALVTGDYEETVDFTVTSNVADFKVEATAPTHVVGGPNSNGYTVAPTLTIKDAAYDSITYPTVKGSAISTDTATLTDGKFTITMNNAPNLEAFKDKTPIEMNFHKASGEEAVYNVTIDKVAKTILISPQPVTEFEYAGDAVNFIKEDGSGFGMYTAQEGTSCAIEGDHVVITYKPKNTTTYPSLYLGADIRIPSMRNENAKYSLEDGAFSIALPKSYCGYAWPVAPVKATGETTSAQYYLAIPAEDKLVPPEPEPADYTAVNAAKAGAEAINRGLYTDDSLAVLDAAVDAVVEGKMSDEQSVVDDWAAAINNAIAALVLKDADYSAVEAAQAKAAALDRSLYIDSSLTNLDAALDAVVTGKKADEQAAVDAMAKAIEDAITSLIEKPADYTAVGVAKEAAAAINRDLYTADSLKAVDDAVAAVPLGVTASHQAEIDAMVAAINDAIAALVPYEDSLNVVMPSSVSGTFGSGTPLTVAITPAPAKAKYDWYECDDTAKSNPVLRQSSAAPTYTMPADRDAGTYYFYCAYTCSDIADGPEIENGGMTMQSAMTAQGAVSKETDVMTVTVEPADISTAAVTADDQVYDGTAKTPAPKVVFNDKTLVAGTDYDDAKYASNINAGAATVTVKGTGNYKGVAAGTFAIKKAIPTIGGVTSSGTYPFGTKLSSIKLSGTASVDGIFSWAEGDTVPNVADSDTTSFDVVFTPSDTANWETAKAKATVKITALDASKAEVTTPDMTYTGKELMPEPVVKLNGMTLVAGIDYDVANLKNNKEVGTATFDVVFKGNYAGKVEGATFKIVKGASTKGSTTSSAKTGDSLPSALIACLMLLALLSAGMLIGRRRFGR